MPSRRVPPTRSPIQRAQLTPPSKAGGFGLQEIVRTAEDIQTLRGQVKDMQRLYEEIQDVLKSAQEEKDAILTDTQEQADAFLKEFRTRLTRERINSKGDDGKTPVAGVDFVVPNKEEIARYVLDTIGPIKPPSAEEVARLALEYISLPDESTITAKIVAKMRPTTVDHEAIAERVITKIIDGKRLKPSHVDGFENEMASYRNQMAMRQAGQHGGGDTVGAGSNITITNVGGTKVISSTGGAGLSIITVAGTINDVNVTFTAASEPTLLNINGSFYQKTGGAFTWTYVAGTITLSSPVGTNGTIFGI